MGQRHQAFLIARVRPYGVPPEHPGNRRCIAAFHHQWCYGRRPSRAMRRLVTLISQPENAAIIRAELCALNGKYGSHGEEKPTIPQVPCPYTASLLGCAWTTQLGAKDEYYESGGALYHDLLSAAMDCWGGDNNDGISVLDVTDPERPSYCFLMTWHPLDARGYLNCYYDVPEEVSKKAVQQGATGSIVSGEAKTTRKRESAGWQDDPLSLIQDLAHLTIIPAVALREAWPRHDFSDIRTHEVSGMSQVFGASDPHVVESAIETVPTLAALSLDIAVRHAIGEGKTEELEKLLWLPGKAMQVKSKLHDLDQFTESAMHLLINTFMELQETSHVDLTGFQLSGAQVAALLAALKEIRSVDLSANASLIADDLLDIIAAAPTLRRIVLMNCASVDGTRLLEIVDTSPSTFKGIEGILHPAFLTITKPDPYPCAFTYAAALGQELCCVSLPFFTPSQIVQALTEIIPWRPGSPFITSSGKFTPRRMDARPLVGCSAFQSGTREPGQTVHERTVVTVPFLSPRIPRGQKNLWTFVRQWRDWMSDGTDSWGFVHYTRRDASQPITAEEPEAWSGAKELQRRMMDPGEGKVYDLRGFLECMEREGRPMPAEDAVEQLDDILFAKDPLTGEYYCQLMTQEEVASIDVSRERLRYEEDY